LFERCKRFSLNKIRWQVLGDRKILEVLKANS
jgi:hypothetical protein